MTLLQQGWVTSLPVIDQATLLQVIRAPDTLGLLQQPSAIRNLLRSYRGVVCNGGLIKRPLAIGERGDDYMCAEIYDRDLRVIFRDETLKILKREIEAMQYHWVCHFIAAARLVSMYHPSEKVREFWKIVHDKIL